MKNFLKITKSVIILAACVAVAASCKKENPKSSACEIIAFTVNGVDWDVSATNITHTYPTETAEGQLTPVISLSPGATVTPASNTAQNFFADAGVTYTVTAEDGKTTKNYVAKATVQDIVSGITGDCTWALTGTAGNYTLTVSGEGAMGNYSEASPPWNEYMDDIKTVVIREGVTTVGAGAFDACSNLTAVTISNSVITIEVEAFDACRSLTGIIIPNSVITIEEEAFENCENLMSVSIGNSVTTIAEEAFKDCGLTSVTIPNSVIAIGKRAFGSCGNLTAINVEAANPAYSSIDGVLFNKDQTILVAYPGGKSGDYTISNSVITVGYYAFYDCSGLTTITIGNSVETIDSLAFEGCSGLTDVIIPNSATFIGYYAFSDCSGLTTITIGNSVETIGYYAFYGCSGLTTVTNMNPVPQDINNKYVLGDVNTDDLTLRVPASAVEAYRTVPVWKDFGTIIAIE
jgi:hypothetical protein